MVNKRDADMTDKGLELIADVKSTNRAFVLRIKTMRR